MAMYNKIITFLVLTFIVSFSYAQQYTPMTAAGYQYKRAKVDSTLHIPSFCGVPTLRNSTAIQGAIAMDTCANKLYQWTNAAGWSIISGAGGGGGTLQSVTDSGNTTTNDIQLLNHARVILGDSGEILLDNGSKLRMGAIDAQTGGSKGIAQICAVGYELKWEGGSLYIMNDQGFTVREVRYKFSSIPTATDDGSKGFYPGSRWVLDNGTLYTCTDSTSGAAVWQNTTYPSLQDVATVGNFYVNDFADTLRLNSYDGNVKHPILWTNDQYGGTPYSILDFSYNTGGFIENVAQIKFGDSSNLLASGYIKITDKESVFKNESSTRTIIQNTYSPSGSTQTTYFPLMKGTTDTLATLDDIRNSASGGTVTSIGLTMPSAFSVASSPVTTSGTIAVTGAGVVSQYIRGDGSLANFPTSTGGGSSVNYYLNGSVSQGTIGGVAFREMNKTPIIGAGTNFTINADGYIQSFITDSGDPSLLNIPAGNWNFEMYFSASSAGGLPSFYLELYKWNGTTLSLIASSSATPENITGGTAIDLYTTALAVPATTLLSTDRLAVRVYVIHSSKTITLHTENSHLCQIITTFSSGLTALNGLTEQVQNFATGTGGTDFNISSATATHTFNLPTASAINRGALSSANWSTFNSKISPSDTASMLTPYINLAGTGLTKSSQTLSSNLSTGVAGGQSVVGGTAASNSLTLSSTTNATKGKILFGTSAYDEVNNRLGIGNSSPVTTIDAYSAIGRMSVHSTNNSQNSAFLLYAKGASGTEAGGGLYFEGNETASSRFFAISADNTNYQMNVYNNGNVAIGTNPVNAGYKLDVNGTARANQFQLSALNTAPATSTSTGTTGEIRIVNGFIYVCVATNTWQRATLSTF